MPEIKLEIPQAQINQLIRRLNRYGRQKKERVNRLVANSAFNIERNAKRAAPVNKKKGLGGQLRSQIRTELLGNTAYVVAGADYSIFQELGTGRRGSSSGVEAKVAGYVYGSVAGVPAQPFLFPAFKSELPKLIGKLEKELVTI